MSHRKTDLGIPPLATFLNPSTRPRQKNQENELTFPFSIRYGMLLWRALFFRAQWFEPDPTKSAQWNRGAYLVEALGHCGDCHTPRNFMGATVASERFKGAGHSASRQT